MGFWAAGYFSLNQTPYWIWKKGALYRASALEGVEVNCIEEVAIYICMECNPCIRCDTTPQIRRSQRAIYIDPEPIRKL